MKNIFRALAVTAAGFGLTGCGNQEPCPSVFTGEIARTIVSDGQAYEERRSCVNGVGTMSSETPVTLHP